MKKPTRAPCDDTGAPIARPPLLKLQTFALAPGQCLIPKCSFCHKVLPVDVGPAVTMLLPCTEPKCVKARQVIDAA